MDRTTIFLIVVCAVGGSLWIAMILFFLPAKFRQALKPRWHKHQLPPSSNGKVLHFGKHQPNKRRKIR